MTASELISELDLLCFTHDDDTLTVLIDNDGAIYEPTTLRVEHDPETGRPFIIIRVI